MRLEVLWRDGGDDTIILEDLQGCFEIEGVMRSNGIVDVLPVFKVFVVFGKILGGICKLIIFLSVGSVSSFDTSVEFWASGW